MTITAMMIMMRMTGMAGVRIVVLQADPKP